LEAFAASAARRHFLPTSLGFIVLAASKARVAAHTGGDFRKKCSACCAELGVRALFGLVQVNLDRLRRIVFAAPGFSRLSMISLFVPHAPSHLTPS